MQKEFHQVDHVHRGVAIDGDGVVEAGGHTVEACDDLAIYVIELFGYRACFFAAWKAT